MVLKPCHCCAICSWLRLQARNVEGVEARREGGIVKYVMGEVLALRAHCVHIAHTEAGILTQEYLSSVE